MSLLSSLLAHPLTRGQNVDAPQTTEHRRAILDQKPFLQTIYRDWYSRILERLSPDAKILEIGAGAGFLKRVNAGIIASEVLPVTGVDLVTDCQALPFSDASLDGIVMVDVFHHIPSVLKFLKEATRCVRRHGRIEMIEPWNTPWSKLVYKYLHPEPFEPGADWDIPATGPLSGANGALPWIVFQRDQTRFAREFPMWRVDVQELLMPFSYLFSGGISTKLSAPAHWYKTCRHLESYLNQDRWAMFAHIGMVRA